MENEKNSVKEKKNEQKEAQINVVFSIALLENGQVIITENGQPVYAKAVDFHAKVGEAPEYSLTKQLVKRV